jgi:hypothetical protein
MKMHQFLGSEMMRMERCRDAEMEKKMEHLQWRFKDEKIPKGRKKYKYLQWILRCKD